MCARACVCMCVCVCACTRCVRVCACDAKYARSRVPSRPARKRPGTERRWEPAAKNRERRRVANHPRGTPPRARERKKITGAARPAAKITTPMTPSAGSARFLKITLFPPHSVSFSPFFAFRLIVENVRRTKMVSRGTLDALSRTSVSRAASSSPPRSSFRSAAFRFRFRPPFPRAIPLAVHSSVANEKLMAWVSAGEEAAPKVRPVFVLFHLLSFLSLA